MKKYAKEIKLAVTSLCAILIIYYGINFLKGINMFQSYNTYYVNFTDVTGLEESNAVYANGYPIGIVREINYDYEHSENIMVKIEVDSKMRFTEDSHAELKSALLGGTTMNIVLGQSKTILPDEGTFKGYPENGLMDKVSSMTPTIENILPKVDSILAALNVLINDPALAHTLSNTEYITGNLRITTDQLNKMMKTDMPVLMAQLKEISTNSAQITSNLKNIDYAATIQTVNGTLTNVSKITSILEEKINSKNNTLGLLVNDDELYHHLNGTLRNSEALMKDADLLMQDFKSHPKRYVHFSVFGKKDN